MRVQTEYMWFKTHWTISSSHNFQVHQQPSPGEYFSQTALHQFKVLAGMLHVFWIIPTLVTSTSRLDADMRRVVTGTPGCSAGCHHTCYVLPDLWPLFPGAPQGHCCGTLISAIWPPCNSSLTTRKHCQRLPVRIIHFADVLLTIQVNWIHINSTWVYRSKEWINSICISFYTETYTSYLSCGVPSISTLCHSAHLHCCIMYVYTPWLSLTLWLLVVRNCYFYHNSFLAIWANHTFSFHTPL